MYINKMNIFKVKIMSKKQQLSKQSQRPVKPIHPKKNKNGIEQRGVIVENCGNTNFKIQLDINPDIIVNGTISGKMRMHYIKVNVGDSVIVEMSPYDLTHCRITKRLN